MKLGASAAEVAASHGQTKAETKVFQHEKMQEKYTSDLLLEDSDRPEPSQTANHRFYSYWTA